MLYEGWCIRCMMEWCMLYFTIWSIGIAKYDGQFAYVYAKRGQVRRYCISSQQSSTYRSLPPPFMYVYLSIWTDPVDWAVGKAILWDGEGGVLPSRWVACSFDEEDDDDEDRWWYWWWQLWWSIMILMMPIEVDDEDVGIIVPRMDSNGRSRGRVWGEQELPGAPSQCVGGCRGYHLAVCGSQRWDRGRSILSG